MMGLLRALVCAVGSVVCFYYAFTWRPAHIDGYYALATSGAILLYVTSGYLIRGIYDLFNDLFNKRKMLNAADRATGTAWTRLKALGLGVAATYRLVQDMSKPSDLWKTLRGEDQAAWNALQASGKE